MQRRLHHYWATAFAILEIVCEWQISARFRIFALDFEMLPKTNAQPDGGAVADRRTIGICTLLKFRQKKKRPPVSFREASAKYNDSSLAAKN